MSIFCWNEDEHRREGREDYERRGYYDREKYRDPLNDCNRYYTEGYDQAKRDDERREERREEERLEEARMYRQAEERRERLRAEEDYYHQEEIMPQSEPPIYDPTDDLPF